MPELSHLQSSQFFALSLDLFCVADAQGYFRMINPAWVECLGYTEGELLARPYIDFVHPDDHDATVTEQRNLDSGERVMNFENRYRHKDGSWRWLSWKAVPQPDGSVYAVARNITQQKEKEEATQQLVRQLEQSNRELDQFAFIVSHDLKSPLRSIINLSQWIKEDIPQPISPEVNEHFTLLQARALRMQSLIDDLLTYAKAGRDAQPVELVDMNKIVEDLMQQMQAPASFQVRIPKPFSPVRGRRGELSSLFQNLMCNAAKYRSVDDGYVEVTQRSEGNMWRFEFRDNGIGIDPKHHQRIFQIFHRLHPEETVEGTGIGLALVKKIVEHAGGRIEVDSELGKGSMFAVLWPK